MKLFTINDLQKQVTDEGYEYFNCIMANGLELQVDPQSWGWNLAVYDINGRLIDRLNQPILIDLAGFGNHNTSQDAMLMQLSRLYGRVVHRRSIVVDFA